MPNCRQDQELGGLMFHAINKLFRNNTCLSSLLQHQTKITYVCRPGRKTLIEHLILEGLSPLLAFCLQASSSSSPHLTLTLIQDPHFNLQIHLLSTTHFAKKTTTTQLPLSYTTASEPKQTKVSENDNAFILEILRFGSTSLQVSTNWLQQ